MWKFKNPIKHPILETRWPTAEEAARSRLFSPSPSASLKHEAGRGFRRWFPGARLKTVLSRSKISTGTGVLLKDGRECSLLKPLACATFRAVLCCASATIDSFPDCGSLSKQCVKRAMVETLLFIQIIDFLAVKRRPEKAKYFQRFLVVDDHHRRALAEVTEHTAWLTATDDRGPRVFAERWRRSC